MVVCGGRATVAGYGRGGGAADLGRGQAVVRAVVVEESCAQGLFISGERRWSAVEAGQRARRPLMVVGLVGAARFAAAVQTTGRLGQRPSGTPDIPDAWCAWGRTVACACSAWAGAVREQGGEKKKRRRKKGEGKRKREKERREWEEEK